MAKDSRIALRMDSDLTAKIQKLADKDGRSVSDYVRRVLVNHTKKK